MDWNSRLQQWEQGSGAQGWDSPSDGLWDRIANDLPQPPPPKRKKAAWIWWSIAGSLLLLVTLGILLPPVFSDTSGSPLGEEPSTKEDVRAQEGVNSSFIYQQGTENESPASDPTLVDKASDSSSKKKAKTDPVISIPAAGSSPAAEGADFEYPQAKQNSKRVVPATPSEEWPVDGAANVPEAIAIGENALSSPAASPLPLTEDEPVLEASPLMIAEEEEAAKATSVAEPDQLSVVSPIPSLLAPLLGSPTLDLGEPRPMVTLNPQWYLGLQASIPSAQQQTQGSHRIRQQSFDPRWELWVGRKLGGRWQVEVGYAQEGGQLLRQTSFVRRFDPQNEQLQNDQNVTVYKLNVLDDSGSTNQEVEVKLVRRPGQSILSGDRVLIQTDIREQLQVRSIPIRIGYDLWRHRSWQWQALAGVEWQYQRRSIEVERVMVQQPWFDPLVLTDQQRQREQQKEMFRFTTGVRTSFQLSPRLGLYLQPQWSWGNTTVKTQNFHCNGGAFWRF